MLSKEMLKKLNLQFRYELEASYSYLAMAAWCEGENWTGAAKFFRIQSQEETGHAMKLLDYMLDRKALVKFEPLTAPDTRFASLLTVFEKALQQEQQVTQSINSLLDVAYKDRDYATVNLLNWFAGEQTEEEATMDRYVSRLKLVGDLASGLLFLDAELGNRVPEPPAGGGA